MTLSRFLRDFIYIPLGGSRGARWRTARNVLITMLLGGLWHGAAWTFVLWGGFHGTALAVERELRGRVRAPPVWLRWLLVFHLVAFAWVLFRAPDIGAAGTFFTRLVEPGAATLWTVPAVLAIGAVIGLQLVPERPIDRLRVWFEDLAVPALASALIAVILLVSATIPSQGVPPFIYFQF
jgi:D-alanyl-lipoteichoic acid acyltransferase DltB (MBOAT superfamily)